MSGKLAYLSRFVGSLNARILGLVLLLVAELECLLVSNYPIRTELRALFKLPLYHVLLTFLTLACLLRWFSPHSFQLPRGLRFSWPWLGLHLGLYALLWTKLNWVWNYTHSWPGLEQFFLWCGIGLGLLGTWLLSWLPLRYWSALWNSVRSWVSWVLPLSLAAPYIAEVASGAWLSFALLTFSLTELVLSLFYNEVVVVPHQLLLGTPEFVVEIQPGCSGYEGMGLIAVLLSGYLWLKRHELKFPQALLVLPLGVVLAYYANILRLVLLIALGTEVSPDIAMKGFHSQAGWISFTVLSIAMIYLIERSGYLARTPQVVEEYTYASLPFLGPLIALLASTMVIKAFSDDFEYLYFLKPLVVGFVLIGFWKCYRLELPRPNWLGSVLTGVFVYLLWIALVPCPDAASPFKTLPGALGVAWVAFRCLGAIVAVPLAEELAFRGYLYRRFQHRDFDSISLGRFAPLSAVLTSGLFAALHSSPLAGMLASLVYTWLYTRPGHLSNAVIAHAVTNACLALQVLLLGHWGLWL